MKFICSSAVLATLVSMACAQAGIISVISPLAGTQITAGSQFTISWINPQVATITQINLAKGPSTALQPIATLADNVDAKTGKFVWNVPADLAAGNDYALEFGTSPNLAFTGPLTIKAADGSAPPASNSTSNTPVSTVPTTEAPSTGSTGANTGSPSANTGSPATTAPVSGSAPTSSSNTAASAPHGSGADRIQVAGKVAAALGVAAAVAQLL